MPNQEPKNHFGEDHAAAYDTRFAKLAPFKDALHLCTRAVLMDLPERARVLCVGAGTGAEVLYLAEAFPGWTFTAVEPSAAMLNRCREKTAEASIADRCTFHEGYLDTLPPCDLFDAATSILVSQFVLVRQKRCNFFEDIAARLRPCGDLITADLATDPSGGLTDAWMALMRYNDFNDEQIAQYRAALRKDVAVLPPHEVEAIIVAGGFEAPLRICQTLLFHAWHTRRNP